MLFLKNRLISNNVTTSNWGATIISYFQVHTFCKPFPLFHQSKQSARIVYKKRSYK